MSNLKYNDSGTPKTALAIEENFLPYQSQGSQIQPLRNIGIPAGIAFINDNSNHDYQLEYYNTYILQQTDPGTRFSLPPVSSEASINDGKYLRVICDQTPDDPFKYKFVEIYDYGFNNLIAVIYPGMIIDFYAVGFSISQVYRQTIIGGWLPLTQSDIGSRNPVFVLTDNINMSFQYASLALTTDNLGDRVITLRENDDFPIGGYFKAFRDNGSIVVVETSGPVALNGQTGTNYKLVNRFESQVFFKVGTNDWRTSWPRYNGGNLINVSDSGNNQFSIEYTGGSSGASGTYSPSLLNVAGFSSFILGIASYTTVSTTPGNWCTITVRFTATPTAISGVLSISIPIGNNFPGSGKAQFIGGSAFDNTSQSVFSSYRGVDTVAGNAIRVAITTPTGAINIPNTYQISLTYEIQ